MSTDLIKAGKERGATSCGSTLAETTGSLVANQDRDDPFAVTFAPAQPTLAAARQITALQELGTAPELDINRAEQNREEARERFETIPPDATLYGSIRLFKAAMIERAPEAWLHAAIGLMLDGQPGAEFLPASYRHGIIDSIINDDVLPPFSCAALIMAIRDLRRNIEGVPSPATFIKACTQNRSGFRRLIDLTEKLIVVRQNAEDVLIKLGEVKVEGNQDDPF
jgi:hypothetical protein